MQIYSRKTKTSLDRVGMTCNMRDDLKFEDLKVLGGPKEGAYIYGLVLQSGKWNEMGHYLGESRLNELFTPLPILQFLPLTLPQPTPLHVIYIYIYIFII